MFGDQGSMGIPVDHPYVRAQLSRVPVELSAILWAVGELTQVVLLAATRNSRRNVWVRCYRVRTRQLGPLRVVVERPRQTPARPGIGLKAAPVRARRAHGAVPSVIIGGPWRPSQYVEPATWIPRVRRLGDSAFHQVGSLGADG
jgi:hypothetical protein